MTRVQKLRSHLAKSSEIQQSGEVHQETQNSHNEIAGRSKSSPKSAKVIKPGVLGGRVNPKSASK